MIVSFLAQPWAERLGWTLLHFLWQGVLIAKLFAAARGIAGGSLRPNARYRLACATLAAMAIAPVVTYWLIGTGSPLIPADAAGWSARPFAAAYSSAAHNVVEGWRMNVPALAGRVLPWIVMAWLSGVLAFSIRLAGGWAIAARLRSANTSRPAPDEWQSRLDRLIARVGVSRPVRLLVSSLAQAPAVIGCLRPAILMPMGALTGLSVEQIEALLAHELAHIRRHDYLINLLQSAAEALLFYHPSVWWISNQIRVERELCCDDIAVSVSGDVFTYASALAAIEAERPARLHTAMAASGGSLADRIRRLLDPAQVAPHTQPSPGAAAALAILLLAGIAAAAMDRSVTSAPVRVIPRPEAPPRTVSVRPPAELWPAPVTRQARDGKPRTDSQVLSPAEPTTEPARFAEAQSIEVRAIDKRSSEPRSNERQSHEAQSNEPARPPMSSREVEEATKRARFLQVRTWNAVEGEPVLHAIEFRGMTEEFAAEVLARLPVREGERVSHAAREAIGQVIRDYGRRLEFGMSADGDGGAVLRIHPPGSARADVLRTEAGRK